ncbi:MAG TPA: phage holin family protein [Thauera phenylacetica]|nr:phage holin family protein [Thauera phenylacetica]
MSTEPRAPRPRLAESLHGIVDAGLQTAQTRLELLAVELQEEKLRLTGLALNTVLAGLLLGFGLVFLMVFLTVLFWEGHRLLALGISTAVCIGGGLIAASNAARAFRSGTRLFSASLAELARDRAALREPD